MQNKPINSSNIMQDYTTLLFFDDNNLNRRLNLIRRVGRPELVEEGIFVDPYANPTWAYPTVFRLPDTGAWRCLYQAQHKTKQSVWAALVAESDDGVHWKVPDLTEKIHLPDRIFPHQILPRKNFGEWGSCYVDEMAEDPEERIKGFIVYHPEQYRLSTRLVISPDGLYWKDVAGVKWSPDHLAPDPEIHVFRNNIRKSYIITTRPMCQDRRIAIIETRDWRTFTEPELVLGPDAQDTPLAELYGMPVFPYEGIFIGFLWVFHPTPEIDESNQFFHKYMYGKIDCQLAYSRNGWHFQRTLREPLIGNDNINQFGGGCIYPSCMMVDDEKSIRIYSSASKPEHGIVKDNSGAVILHKLRLDGFIFLETGGGPGLLGTRLLYWRGGELRLNVQAPWGEVRVQVTDSAGLPFPGYSFEDCVSFTGDELSWEPKWKDGRRMASFSGKLLRFEVRMNNARLYAIRGDFLPLVRAEARRFEQYGEIPQPRPGI